MTTPIQNPLHNIGRPAMLPGMHCAGPPVCDRQRSGFTLIELLVVLGIAILLAAAAIPGVAAATRRAAINGASTALVSVISEAQRLARTRSVVAQPMATAPHFGVAIVLDEGPAYATLLYGTEDDHEYRLDADGDGVDEPVRRVRLPGSVRVEIEPEQPRIAWFFQYGTGMPIASPADQRPINIGDPGAPEITTTVRTGASWQSYRFYDARRAAIPASPVCTALRLRAAGDQLALAITQYEIGLVAVAEAQ